MAMVMEDFEIPHDEWVEVPLLADGTYLAIVMVRQNPIVVKIGEDSTSEGIILDGNVAFISPEPVFVKTDCKILSPGKAIITIIRDKP